MLESSSPVSKTAQHTSISGDSLTSDHCLKEFHTLMMKPGERPSDYLKRLNTFIHELLKNNNKDHNLSSQMYEKFKRGCTDLKLLQKLSRMDPYVDDFGTLLHNVRIIKAKRTRAKLMSKQTEVPVISSKSSRTNTQKNSVSLPKPRLHLSAKDGNASLNATPRSSIWAPSICPYSCFKCGRYGHIARFCRYKRNPQLAKHTGKKYVLPTDVMDMEVNWSEEQGKDKTVARVINIIITKQHINALAETKEVLKLFLRKRRKLLLIDNILCRIIHGKSAVQIVVPTHLRQLVMNKFHNDNDHPDPPLATGL